MDMSGKSLQKKIEFDQSTFDIESYIDDYQGYTKLSRLIFMVENIPALHASAATLLFQELKRGINIGLYLKTWASLNEALQNEIGYDEAWLTATKANAERTLSYLDADLSSAKSAMAKEKIRVGHTEVGHLHYQMGNLNDALKSFLRTRDFCASARHNCDMCVNVIGVSIDLNQYFNASNFINKVTDDTGDVLVIAKLKAASALVDLRESQFKKAALTFLHIDPALGSQFNTTLSAEDIGVYGAMCAMASLSRTELNTHLIENKDFVGTYLSLHPDVKTLALGFYSGEYGTVLQLLPVIRSRLQADIHLNTQMEPLLALISERVMLQYFVPYCAVDLGKMGERLCMAPAVLEEALVALISAGKLSARIDAQQGVLLRRENNPRQSALDRVLRLSQVHARTTKRDILRLSLLQQGFCVDAEKEHSDMTEGGSYRSRSFDREEVEGLFEGEDDQNSTGQDPSVPPSSSSVVEGVMDVEFFDASSRS
ncbi:26S proteasome subunit RPN7-domain-containing protein [Ochromonadaceae sp. CCMP2298]|nr:26S proteasome subunit RPN7-domain-containing protein [Ochromonadaceae sp. CCMP2298]|mmetsp:Transcript_4698/g.10568  ORF Transcript_4698/g.10568 Transcript_4698/m.10568 type:complete len:484 (-) Transcript_4698:114-1565(-)